MPGQFGSANAANIAIYVVLIALVLYRSSRSQRISVARMWFYAILLMFLAGLAISGSFVLFRPPVWQIGAAVVLGLLAGIPVGLLRGHHTQVRATERHGVMQLGPNWATAAIYIGAFVARFIIRSLLPPTSAVGNVVSDGLLFFAVGIVGATYFAVYQKYEALDHATTAQG